MERLIASLLGLGIAAAAPVRAEAPEHVFALIVASNGALRAEQAELQYADDDAARYQRLFRALAEEGDVALLTELDRGSRDLYPGLAEQAAPATRENVLAARDALRTRMAAARAAGERTAFYFVYAGHGQVREGRGVLALDDGELDGAFIERELIETLLADTSHVILDSCDSFFVMNPRKPGGRRWATPADMALGFSARHPEVGLFLSTSSASEVYEWSELEAGVFSHEVRSGLSGAADADGDGAVSYLELAAFLDRANAGIRRPALRPHVYARGPHGDAAAALFPSARMRGRLLVLPDGELSASLRSADGERLMDLHKEEPSLRVRIPEGISGELSLRVKGVGTTSRSLHVPESPDELALASLAPELPQARARGEHGLGELFAAPFGPRAVAEYAAREKGSEPPVYGLSEADVTRMHHYVQNLADMGRQRRVYGSVFGLGIGAGASVAALLYMREEDPSPLVTGSLVGLGALAIGEGLVLGLRPSEGERALATFERERRAARTGERAFAETDALLEAMARRARRKRLAVSSLYAGAAGFALVAGSMALADRRSAGHSSGQNVSADGSARFGDAQPSGRFDGPLLIGEAALLGAVSVLGFVFESQVERAVRLYRDDPTLSFAVSPLAGGAFFSLRRRF